MVVGELKVKLALGVEVSGWYWWMPETAAVDVELGGEACLVELVGY